MKLPAELTINNAPTPPGTIKIANNLYFDKTELTNISYLEFMFWTKKIFGTNSDEYNSILPDTNVWSMLNIGYASLDTFYLRHPAYRDFPVVGVSYEQATAYSKWRSDRVMEYLLIKKEIIPYIPTPPKDSVFTIDKYFLGQYYGVQPNQQFLIYPYYSLPDSITYTQASLYADSLNAKNYKYCRKKFCADLLLTESNCIENKTNKTEASPYGPDPTMATTCVFCKKELITHLKGNVREMTNIKGQFYGSSFIDSCKTPNNIFRQDTLLINSYTGFRNICEYRQWKK
ncbi:MAG: SUMF1/EgtB/PvdO family nonheme iron enzyme [Bacteroidales bacterium]|jgi:hypothetical protein